MTGPKSLSDLRANGWSSVPSSSGVYWWYFPKAELDSLRITELCNVSQLQLRYAPDGKVCLYHGMAKSLAQRVKWHAAQDLTLNNLRSGFLSTFRFTLLALNDFDYLKGPDQINNFFDGLSVSWQTAESREAAKDLEEEEFQGTYHYPLNIQGNRRSELKKYIRYLRSVRKAYKNRYVK